MSDVEWRPIRGYEGIYEVSDDGQVRSLTRMVRGRWGEYRVQGRVMKPTAYKGGYWRICLRRDSVRQIISVHLLVLDAFVGPRPDGMQGCHNDGDPTNNRLDNLRWGTPSENMQDCLRHGNHPQVNKTHCPSGHPYDDENTDRRPDGSRRCRTCHREREARARGDVDLVAALCEVTRLAPDQLPPPQPWSEAREQRMSHVAETYDPETGRSQGLLPPTEETP